MRQEASAPGFARTVACAGLIALPFVSPFVEGPSANVWQQLVAWICVALLLVTGPTAPLSRGVAIWLSLVGTSLILGCGSQPALGLSAGLAVAVAGLAACVGAGLERAPAMQQAAWAWGLLAAGLLSSVLGLLQYYGIAAALVPWTSAPELGHAYGNLRQRNQFATLISMALISALWLHAISGPRMRTALLPAGALLTLAAAASTSRTGLLQLLLIVGVAAFLARREREQPARGGAAHHRLPPPWLLFAFAPFYFIAAWLLPLLAGPGVESMTRRLHEGAPFDHSRWVLWRNVLDLIALRPWSGWGWGELSFAHYSTFYGGTRFVEILDNAHNLPLHLAVELGVPATLLICGGFGWLVFTARPWRETDPPRLMAWGVMGAIVLHSLLEYPLWYGPFQLAFGLCLGFLWPGAAKGPGSARRRRAAPVFSMAAAVVLATIVAYAAWDYARISQVYVAREQRWPAWRDDTLAKIQGSWIFAGQVKFATLALMPVSRNNAVEVHALAQRVLHFSPEPRVITKLIESTILLGRYEEAIAQAARFRIAFPREYARWLGKEPMGDPSE